MALFTCKYKKFKNLITGFSSEPTDFKFPQLMFDKMLLVYIV